MADLEQAVLETIRAQMCPALGIDSSKDKLNLQTVQQAEHEEKLRSIQDSKRQLYEQYALGEIDLETYQERKAVYDAELVQALQISHFHSHPMAGEGFCHFGVTAVKPRSISK